MVTTFGSRLKEKRKEKKLTQAELSNLTGISQHSIIALENDKTVPRKSSVEKFAKALDVSVDYLLGKEIPVIPEDEIDLPEDVVEHLKNVKALFAGGDCSEEDKDKLFRALTKAYLACKDKAEERAKAQAQDKKDKEWLE